MRDVIRIFRHYIPRSLILLGLLEFLILVYSVYLGVWLRFMDAPVERAELEPISLKALLFAAVMVCIMAGVGLYQRHFREGMGGVLLRVGLSAVLGLAVMSFIFYTFPSTFLGRGAFGIAAGVATIGILAARAVFFRLVDQETLKSRILVLGAGKRAEHLAMLRRRSDRRGCHIVGYVHVPGEHDVVEREIIIRRDTTLLELAQQRKVDEIVVAVEDRRKNFPVQEILDCRMAGIEVMDILTFLERQLGRVMLNLLHPSWLIFSDGFRYGVVRVVTKRSFDILASSAVLAVTWPLMVAAALAIFIESGVRGPILYRQVRKGDMSFVGPRPERPIFVEQLSEKIPFYSERHRGKPGITGWAQISYPYGASEEDAVQKLQYDLYYVKNYSVFLDLLILLQTAEVVIWGRGAR